MARKQIPIILPLGPYPGTVAANALDFVFTTADSSNFDQFNFTGRELIIVRNSTGGTLTFTLESTVDDKGRLGDITAYSLSTLEFAAFWTGNGVVGWNNAGQFFLRSSASTMDYAIFKIPG
jgi:hypothetical protein